MLRRSSGGTTGGGGVPSHRPEGSAASRPCRLCAVKERHGGVPARPSLHAVADAASVHGLSDTPAAPATLEFEYTALAVRIKPKGRRSGSVQRLLRPSSSLASQHNRQHAQRSSSPGSNAVAPAAPAYYSAESLKGSATIFAAVEGAGSSLEEGVSQRFSVQPTKLHRRSSSNSSSSSSNRKGSSDGSRSHSPDRDSLRNTQAAMANGTALPQAGGDMLQLLHGWERQFDAVDPSMRPVALGSRSSAAKAVAGSSHGAWTAGPLWTDPALEAMPSSSAAPARTAAVLHQRQRRQQQQRGTVASGAGERADVPGQVPHQNLQMLHGQGVMQQLEQVTPRQGKRSAISRDAVVSAAAATTDVRAVGSQGIRASGGGATTDTTGSSRGSSRGARMSSSVVVGSPSPQAASFPASSAEPEEQTHRQLYSGTEVVAAGYALRPAGAGALPVKRSDARRSSEDSDGASTSGGVPARRSRAASHDHKSRRARSSAAAGGSEGAVGQHGAGVQGGHSWAVGKALKQAAAGRERAVQHVRPEVAAFGEAVGLSAAEAAALVQREPLLLQLSQQELATQVFDLLAVVTLCAGPPGAASASQGKRPRKTRQAPLQHPQQQQEQHAVYAGVEASLAGTGSQDEEMAKPLFVPNASLLPRVGALVRSHPQLLRSPADAPAVVAALLRLMRGDVAAVAAVLRKCPLLLTEQQPGRPMRGRDVPVAGVTRVGTAEAWGGPDTEVPEELDAGGVGSVGSVGNVAARGHSGPQWQHGAPGVGISCEAGVDAASVNEERYGQVFCTALAGLQQLLGLEEDQAVELVLREPALLRLSPGAMATAAAALSRPLQLTTAQLRDLLLHSPDLLCASPGALSASCRYFARSMTSSSTWSAQLPALVSHPRNLAVALSFDTARYDRLHYLVTTRRDHGISFKSALSMPQAEFEEMYPGYRKWWAAKGR